MPITPDPESLRASVGAKAAFDKVDTSDGSLDPGAVVVQFICNTGGDEAQHDPSKPPDSHVRSSHAALHGKIFALDQAPIPPLSYGCRCAIRYLAVPKTTAAAVLDAAPADEPHQSSLIPSYREWLDAQKPGWRRVARVAADAPPQRRLIVARQAGSDLGMTADEVQMAITASPYRARDVGPMGTSALSGVGRSAKRLVDLWRGGDLDAARKLASSYPATYRRLLAEEPTLVPVRINRLIA